MDDWYFDVLCIKIEYYNLYCIMISDIRTGVLMPLKNAKMTKSSKIMDLNDI